MKFPEFPSRIKISNRQLGASLVEYGLLVVMVSILALAGVRQTGSSVNCIFTKVNGHLQGLEDQDIICSTNGDDYDNGGGPNFPPPELPPSIGDDYDNGGGPSFAPPPEKPEKDYDNGGGVSREEPPVEEPPVEEPPPKK